MQISVFKYFSVYVIMP